MALAVLATLLFVLWPGASKGSDASEDAKPRVPSAQQGASAAKALRALPAVNLSMVYAPTQRRPMTRANLTVDSTGKASGTLSEPVVGKSTLAWSGDQLYLKGDASFWAQQDPQFGHDLTSAGHWIKSEKRDGYYMLDSFAVNVGSLTPASLATLVRQVTSDPEAVREDGATFQGRKAVSYNSGGWTVVLAAESPYPVLAIGGDPSHDDPVKPAVWHPAGRTGPAMKPAGHRANTVSADGLDLSSYLTLVPKPATTEQMNSVRTTTATAVATAVPPATSAEAVSKTMGPAFTTTSNSGSLCTTNPCSYSFTVTNSGDQAGEATLYLTMPQVPTAPRPLGILKPKQSKTVSGTRPNIAWGTGRTVHHTDYAWVYSTAEYGPDPKIGSRLHARNLRPGDLSYSTPLQPTVAGLLDAMTKDRPTSDTEAGDEASDAISEANSQGALPDLGEIVGSGRLNNPEDLRRILPTTDKVDNRRVLQQIALLLQADPHAHVTWTAPPTAGDATPPADYLYTTTEQGQQVKRAVKAETVRSPAELGSKARLGTAQLNGEQPDTGTTGGQKVPSGYERVLRLDLEPSVGPLLDLAATQDLEHSLSTDSQFQPLRDSLCQPNGGGSRVNRLVIVNASGTHQWTDPSQLGASCGSGGASASPDPSSSSRPDNKPTCLTQSPPVGVVETSGAGWIYYAPTGSHKRATAATACLKKPLGNGTASNSNSPGMDTARNRAKALLPGVPGTLVNSCHLIPKEFGGRGIQRNLTPCWATPVNVGEMTDIQTAVRSFLNKGGIVRMTVTAKYKDTAAEIPYAFTFQVTAWDSRGNPYPLVIPGGGTVQNVKSGKNLSP
ncbi:DNA/RNA non-specific endonuclease [Streptomyces sp. WZ.A104]|uniref:DNA/RNA non-specific endonuclease n=1 Tax=Streptomyces sp. WZ.A104 TaxID=2023771 RepID=UPI0015CB2DF6|nr:DNA/RNA non-specific endonuclease [Streptomyces sp. WZ.A104]